MTSLLAAWLGLGSRVAKEGPCPYPEPWNDSSTIVEKADDLQEELVGIRRKKVHRIIRSIIETHSDLLKLPHLRPGKVINQLLGNLVSVCSEIHDNDTVAKVLCHPGVQEILPCLRQICAQAESCLELHWNEHILSSQGNPDEVLARLKTFPYYENYLDLTRMELCTILSATKTAPRRVAFVGSGPLPLTSLCLLQSLKQDALATTISTPSAKNEQQPTEPLILNLDYDPSAIAASQALSFALGEAGRNMEFICADATSPIKDLAMFDVVYMAALVGFSQTDKEGIILQVVSHMRAGSLLVVRSSWGLRTCLYPEVDLATEALLKRLECCVVSHPYGQVVNSVIVARVRA